jgi:hypothetical protein
MRGMKQPTSGAKKKVLNLRRSGRSECVHRTAEGERSKKEGEGDAEKRLV